MYIWVSILGNLVKVGDDVVEVPKQYHDETNVNGQPTCNENAHLLGKEKEASLHHWIYFCDFKHWVTI